MEGLVRRWVQVAAAVAVLAVVAFPSGIARAEDAPYEDPVQVTVDTQPDAVVVEAETEQHTDASGASGTSGPRCHLKEYDPADPDGDPELQYVYYAHKVPYYLICDNQTKSIVWLDYTQREGGPQGSPLDPRDVAMRLRERIPIPQVDVRINPARGLVGAESWFWIEGFDGRALSDSTDAFGELVQVQAVVTRYEWSFGDGATSASETPGRAYPARSEVRHVYERSSAGAASGYQVDVSFVFAVRYRVAGGGWIQLPAIARTASAEYPVRESQSVIER